MPAFRRETIRLTGAYRYGAGPADPTVDMESGQPVGQVGIGFEDDGLLIEVVMGEEATLAFITMLQDALAKAHAGVIVPGNGR